MTTATSILILNLSMLLLNSAVTTVHSCIIMKELKGNVRN
ncbi:hypothetical protein LD13_gp067 [Bacillus phage Bobb]|uniref:Uncharacterized protein n=1 Tax=Bacillus phage Bobb TaxID=1527469 RepID=A0A076G8Q5_9CAUD|nr:hypothetical protein LD13_gp067 [Bacillus phage Bobb]AII27968.1 hypothetical protein [Bacillus phage Bobb]